MVYNQNTSLRTRLILKTLKWSFEHSRLQRLNDLTSRGTSDTDFQFLPLVLPSSFRQDARRTQLTPTCPVQEQLELSKCTVVNLPPFTTKETSKKTN